MRARRVCSVVWLCAAGWLLSACAGAGRPVEQLDARSGMTVVRGPEPLVFARTEPRYSRSARDYVYLGPVETNRQGIREYYLWVGIATTLDRAFLGVAAPVPERLFVEIGGEPIELALKPWHEVVATTFTNPVYATAVPVREELVARVTLQQLALLNAEPLASIVVATATQDVRRRYVRWLHDAGLEDFLERVAGGAARPVQ